MARSSVTAYDDDLSVVEVLVDPDVAPWAGQLRWRMHTSGTKRYVRGTVSSRPFLHRLILGLPPSDPRTVDHVNGDPLDNRRENLRVATVAENAQNQGSRGGSSRYRGVSWDASRGKWIATAMVNGKRKTLGRFDDEDRAGEAAAKFRAEHMPFSAEAQAA